MRCGSSFSGGSSSTAGDADVVPHPSAHVFLVVESPGAEVGTRYERIAPRVVLRQLGEELVQFLNCSRRGIDKQRVRVFDAVPVGMAPAHVDASDSLPEKLQGDWESTDLTFDSRDRHICGDFRPRKHVCRAVELKAAIDESLNQYVDRVPNSVNTCFESHGSSASYVRSPKAAENVVLDHAINPCIASPRCLNAGVRVDMTGSQTKRSSSKSSTNFASKESRPGPAS